MNWEELLNTAYELGLEYGLKIIGAIAILVIGLRVVKIFTKVSRKLLRKTKIDETVIPFVVSSINISLKVLLLTLVASSLGIETTSFAAIIGAATLAIGMALQGSLGNFAGGVLILLFKPYKVGDYIQTQGHQGFVQKIQIFNTILKTLDNKIVILPNGTLSNGSIVNYSETGNLRVDLIFGIGYSSDIRKAKEILERIASQETRILHEPKPFVAVSGLGDSSVDILLRVWCKTEEYVNISFYFQEKVKLEFDKAGIEIPFPQRDVHLHQN